MRVGKGPVNQHYGANLGVVRPATHFSCTPGGKRGIFLAMSTEATNSISRRSFIKRAAGAIGAAAGAPLFIPASALGKDGRPPPSGRITMGGIGIGGMGGLDLRSFLSQPDVQVLAVCDVKPGNRRAAVETVNRQYQTSDCAAGADWRDLLARPDIDAILCATPDHWHALIAIAAARCGKHIYCEKPMSLTIAEGRAVADAVARYGIVYQSGTQRRSQFNYVFCVDAVRKGRIGQLLYIENRMGGSGADTDAPATDPPKDFDYDMWLGPAPWQPHSDLRVSGNFRWIYDYAGGSMTDMGAHYNDICQMIRPTPLDAPVSFKAAGVRFHERGIFDTAHTYQVTAAYEDGLEIRMVTGAKGMRWVGTEGWIDLEDGAGVVAAQPASVLEGRKVALAYWEMAPHHRNFLDCVKSRARPVADAEVAHRSATICHAANICMRLGRPLRWDRRKERFVDDPEADRMLSRAMRAPWTL